MSMKRVSLQIFMLTKTDIPEATKIMTELFVLLTTKHYTISESIELFVIYSNIRVTKNHRQSLQIIKNYLILSDLFESE